MKSIPFDCVTSSQADAVVRFLTCPACICHFGTGQPPELGGPPWILEIGAHLLLAVFLWGCVLVV